MFNRQYNERPRNNDRQYVNRGNIANDGNSVNGRNFENAENGLQFNDLSSYEQLYPDALVSNERELMKCLKILSKSDDIFMGINFVKDNSYTKRISLLCLSNGEDNFAIDFLSEGIDHDLIRQFLFDDKIKKVFYNADNALGAIYNKFGDVPRNIFDLKYAAMLCGIDGASSYSSLVFKICGSDFKTKSLGRATFAQRPMEVDVVDRGVIDIAPLKRIYKFLYARLSHAKRLDWLSEIHAEIINVSKYHRDIATVWKQLPLNSTSMPYIRRVKKLAEWRELTAKKMNVQPQSLMSDSVLNDIADKNPSSYEEFAEVRNLNNILLHPFHARKIISSVSAAQKMIIDDHNLEVMAYDLPKTYIPLVDMLEILLRMKSLEHGVSASLIADKRDLAIMAIHDNTSVPCMKGWRHEIFGKYAMDIKSGKLGFIYENNSVILFESA